MNWKVFCLIAGLTLTTNLTACSSNPPSGTQAAPTETNQPGGAMSHDNNSKAQPGGAMRHDNNSKAQPGGAMSHDNNSKDQPGGAMKKEPTTSKP